MLINDKLNSVSHTKYMSSAFFFFFYPPRFGQFISSTLPTFAVCEKFVVMEMNNEEKLDNGK